MTEEPSITIPVVWPNLETQPVRRVNQSACQISPGPDGRPEEIILIMGAAAPPFITGSPDEQLATWNAVQAIEVDTVARLSFTRGRAQEVVDLLQQALETYDGGRPS